MAAHDIKAQLKTLRVQTGKGRRRRDPFATGFEDDSDDNTARRSRTKTKAPPVEKPVIAPSKTSVASPFAAIDALRDSDDDFLDGLPPKRLDRNPSPAPASLAARRGSVDISLRPPVRNTRAAVALAAGDLAYLDDSSEEEERSRSPRRRNLRGPSPAPRKPSDPVDPNELPIPRIVPPKHTVASPFAGTKYLEDSDTDSNEEAISSRQGSTDSAAPPTEESENPAPLGSPKKHLEIQRVDKKQNGSGVSWRAFSASRTEQRTAEIDALRANLRKRGKSISFGTHATTDDGKRVPIAFARQKSIDGRRRPGIRGTSPPRRPEDTKPTDDEIRDGQVVEIYNPAEFKTSPFTDGLSAIQAELSRANFQAPVPSRTSGLMTSPTSSTDLNAMTESTESMLSRMAVSPQAIPEGKVVDHAVSPLMSPMHDGFSSMSRNNSTRSLRMQTASRPARIPTSRRSSRRSASLNPSPSPAHAFLASWAASREDSYSGSTPEPKPDDEGQSIGMHNEYIIGPTINHGGFGVVKEVHTIDEKGGRIVRAVKIVQKNIEGKTETENEKVQQELEHEVSVWRYLKHRHILDLHAVYDTDYATFCVMDLNIGGTLFDMVRRSRAQAPENDGRKGLDPKLARSYAFQLACALRYLHEDIRVCHRDIKLENCLVDMAGPDASTGGGVLRLCDFGLSDFLHNDQGLDDMSPESSIHLSPSHLQSAEVISTSTSVIGTLEYASPKGLSVNHKLFEPAGDIWAFGVIIYALCTGELPFRHPMPAKTVELIMQVDYDHEALRQAAAGSNAVIELVKGCFERDVDLRLTIGDALRSPWFEGCQEDDDERYTQSVWR